MATVLVTGGDGFTGRYLVDALARDGHDVHVMVRRAIRADDRLAKQCADRIHIADLADRAGLARIAEEVQPHHVIHLAAIAFVAHDDVDSIYRTNIVGSRNLLEAVARTPLPPRSILLASSANVYGNANAEVVDESVAPAPANDYAVSKLAMEYMARTWADRLPIQIVRPFNYTGVGQGESFLIPKIVAHFKRRAPVLELGNLDVERDFSDVRTVVDCYRRVIEAGIAGVLLNVCSGRGTTLREVLDMATDITGHRPEIRINPAFVRANEVRRLVGSRDRLELAIGPVRGPDMRETLEWMLSE